MSTARLPSLHPYLERLIVHIEEPTAAAFDDYLRLPSLLPSERPQWAPQELFKVGNVFASPITSAWNQRAFDLSSDYLADVVGESLLIPPYPHLRFWDGTNSILEDVADGSRWVPDEYQLANLNQAQEERRQQWEAHKHQAEEACASIERLWTEALRFYAGQQATPTAMTPLDELFARHAALLQLEPHVSLPDAMSIMVLAHRNNLPHLILLTARHELGYLYCKVQQWCDRTLDQGRLDPDDVFLTDEDWSRISARLRGYQYTRLGRTNSSKTHGRRRRDAPEQDFSPANDIAALYWGLRQWAVATYNAMIDAPKCESEHGCANIAKPGSFYCRECARERKRHQDQDSYRRTVKPRRR